MNTGIFVWVYRYMYWDPGTQEHKQSDLYATLEAIRCGLGTPLHPTAIRVRLAELREGGIYVPGEQQTA